MKEITKTIKLSPEVLENIKRLHKNDIFEVNGYLMIPYGTPILIMDCKYRNIKATQIASCYGLIGRFNEYYGNLHLNKDMRGAHEYLELKSKLDYPQVYFYKN